MVLVRKLGRASPGVSPARPWDRANPHPRANKRGKKKKKYTKKKKKKKKKKLLTNKKKLYIYIKNIYICIPKRIFLSIYIKKNI